MLSIRSPSRSASGPLEYHSHTRRWSEAELKTRELIRWRMAAVICCVLIVPRAYAAKFHPARGFALSRRPKRRYSTAVESSARLLRSYSRLRACEYAYVCVYMCVYVCVYKHVRVRVRAYIEKATLWDQHNLSLSLPLRLFLSSRFTSAHVHTSAIASLFAPCANCCILHAYEAYALSFFLPLFLSFFLACSLLSSLLTCPLLSAYLLAFLTSRLFWLTIPTFSLAVTLYNVVPYRMCNIIHKWMMRSWIQRKWKFLYANILNLIFPLQIMNY